MNDSQPTRGQPMENRFFDDRVDRRSDRGDKFTGQASKSNRRVARLRRLLSTATLIASHSKTTATDTSAAIAAHQANAGAETPK